MVLGACRNSFFVFFLFFQRGFFSLTIFLASPDCLHGVSFVFFGKIWIGWPASQTRFFPTIQIFHNNTKERPHKTFFQSLLSLLPFSYQPTCLITQKPSQAGWHARRQSHVCRSVPAETRLALVCRNIRVLVTQISTQYVRNYYFPPIINHH